MTQLLLEISNRRDLDLLINLVERLDIRVIETKKMKAAVASSKSPDAVTGRPKVVLGKNTTHRGIVKPLRKKLSIADLKKEQGYKGVNPTRLNRLIDDLEIQEPIETLLAQLKSL
jgi:hypothetical protein